MNGRERISRQLKRLPVDRIGAGESFWSFTAQRWIDEGRMPRDVSCADHFDLDIESCWALRLAIDPVFQPRVIAEDADTQTLLDGNGARLRRHRHPPRSSCRWAAASWSACAHRPVRYSSPIRK